MFHSAGNQEVKKKKKKSPKKPRKSTEPEAVVEAQELDIGLVVSRPNPIITYSATHVCLQEPKPQGCKRSLCREFEEAASPEHATAASAADQLARVRRRVSSKKPQNTPKKSKADRSPKPPSSQKKCRSRSRGRSLSRSPQKPNEPEAKEEQASPAAVPSSHSQTPGEQAATEPNEDAWDWDGNWEWGWNGDDHGYHGWGYWYNNQEGWGNGWEWDWGNRGWCNTYNPHNWGELWQKPDYTGPVLKHKPSWYRKASSQAGWTSPVTTKTPLTSPGISTGKSKKKNAGEAEQGEVPDEEQDKQDEEEAKKLLSEKKKKRKHRARYMRFYRSVTGSSSIL